MPTGLIDAVYLEAGCAQGGEGVSKRPAHWRLPSGWRPRTVRSARLRHVDDLCGGGTRRAAQGSAAARAVGRPPFSRPRGGTPASPPPAPCTARGIDLPTIHPPPPP